MPETPHLLRLCHSSESMELASVRRSMCDSPYWELRHVACEFENGWLVLRGVVSSWYLKQLAQEAARKYVGSVPMVNDIEVLD